MNNQEENVEKFRTVLRQLFSDGPLKDSNLEELANKLAKEAIGSKPASRKELLTMKKPTGKAPKVIYYNLRAALKAIAYAIEAVAANEMVSEPARIMFWREPQRFCAALLSATYHIDRRMRRLFSYI